MTFHLPSNNINSNSKKFFIKYPIKNNASLIEKFLNSQSERTWSFVTSFLAVLCLGLIFATSTQKIQGLIIPLQNLRSWIAQDSSYETFSFAPGSSQKKFARIDFNELKTLAFYDIPVEADGTLVYDTKGYESFKSPEAKTLFETARLHNTKVVITLTQTYNPDIISFLSDQKAQQNLITEAIYEVKEAGIDGVTIDFEFQGENGAQYKNLYTSFIKDFTERMHREIPGSVVSVALGSNSSPDSIYDIPRLAQTVDKVFLMAYSFAVPEVNGKELTAPEYSQKTEYVQAMDEYINEYAQYVPQDKLVVERAWYGTGANYPMYKSAKAQSLSGSENENTLTTPLSKKMINRLVLDVPSQSREAAIRNLPLIAEALEKEGILNTNVLAYALATIEHETAGTFEPIEEIKGRKSARRLGYEGGTNYYGRGFIQLTHLRNYKDIGERIGMGTKLVENPNLASDPKVSAAVLAAFFKDNNVAYWATQGDFITARIPVNPDAQGRSIAMLTRKYL